MNLRYPHTLAMIILGLAMISPLSTIADVEAARVWRAPDHTRLVFDLNAAKEFELFTLTDPERIIIDIKNASLMRELDGLDFTDSPILSLRAAQSDDKGVRVVLDLATKVNPSAFTLGANGEFRDRIVVDLYDIQTSQPVAARATPVATSEEKRDLVVAIVAGHGGEDPGALSFDRKLMEKDVTLAIARAIRDRLNSTPGYKPLMIRDGDYTVKLQDRPNIGRDNRVDIYLSIHADSAPSSAAKGVTIYALSGDTADEENARRVAQKENRADLLGGTEGDISIAHVEDDLALTLLDLSMAWSMEQSELLGSKILAALDGVAALRRDKVQAGNLWELRSPDIPSLLIETGYLTNPDEAKKLGTRGYQEQLAAAIVEGVKKYFYDAPPEGSLVAWQKVNGIKPEAPTSYTVKRGDSLSEIAQRFGITMAELKTHNNLTSDVIQLGKVLKLPGNEAPAAAHTIRRGETLSEIAQQYQISLSTLRDANQLTGDRIMVGQVLQIPQL